MKKIAEHSGCGYGTQVDQMTLRLDRGDVVVQLSESEYTALRTKHPAASEGDGLSRIHAMFRALGFDGLEALPGWGWSYSRSGCAVEAMIENGILLEHFDDWVGFRPADGAA